MYDARMGLNHAPGDSMRYWVQWLATKDNRCLEMSPTYLHSRVLKKTTTWDVNRRESEWNDNGEAYPMTMDGPHIYCSLSVPAGLFYLSLYDMNPRTARRGTTGFGIIRFPSARIRGGHPWTSITETPRSCVRFTTSWNLTRSRNWPTRGYRIFGVASINDFWCAARPG